MSLFTRLRASWRPRPIKPPTVDVHLHQLDSLTRSAESIRFCILSIEGWISKGGQIREWLRHNTHIAAWLGIPALLVVPVVTFILYQVLKWTTLLTTITRHLIVLPIMGLLLVVVLALLVTIIKAMLR